MIVRQAVVNVSKRLHKYHAHHSKGKVRRFSTSTSKLGLENRYISIQCSVDMWHEMPSGLEFDVSYLDSMPGKPYEPRVPTILALHDTPGSSQELAPLLNPLSALGYRVIVPDFPGHGGTLGFSMIKRMNTTNFFTGSSEERVSFVEALLNVLGIKTVEVIVCQGLGSNTGLLLTTTISRYKSLVSICPANHRATGCFLSKGKAEKFTRRWDHPFQRYFLLPYMKYAMLAHGLRTYSVEQMVQAIRTVGAVDYNEVASCVSVAEIRKIPICVIYSSEDPKIPKDTSEEFVDKLGIEPKDITHVDETGKIIQEGSFGFPSAVVLNSNSHEPFLEDKFKGHISLFIWNLVKHICEQDRKPS